MSVQSFISTLLLLFFIWQSPVFCADPNAAEKLTADTSANRKLVASVLAGDHAALREAIAVGADVEISMFIKDGDEEPTLSTLQVATLLGDRTAIKELLKAGARRQGVCDLAILIPLMRPLNSLLQNSSRKATLDNIMQSQAEVSCFLFAAYRIDAQEQSHELLRAIVNEDAEAVKALLASGADINVRETKLPGPIVWPGRTALMIAILEGRLEFADLLIQAGADPNARASTGSAWGGWDGFTALMLIVQLDIQNLLAALLRVGADPLITDESGASAIHYAASAGNLDFLKGLIDAMPDTERKAQMITSRTKNGDTPLVLATRSREPAAVRYIADLGATTVGPAFLQRWGSAALLESVIHREYRALPLRDRAEARESAFEILKMLVERGGDANTADANGVTLLMHALQTKSSLSLIQFLLDNGANPSARDNAGNQATHYVGDRPESQELARLLTK